MSQTLGKVLGLVILFNAFNEGKIAWDFSTYSVLPFIAKKFELKNLTNSSQLFQVYNY